ncbi:MAG: DUF3575 domain-containing protein [Chlorobi bacterium]|nr:DUF3575 domain-containing protein [Chlorobiota bacterium]
MKAKLIGLLILVALIMTVPSQNVEAAKKGAKSVNSVVSLGLGINTIDIMYEKRMSKYNSFTAKVEYYHRYENWNGYGLKASYRWYIKDIIQDGKNPLEGLSAGPFARYTMWSYSADNLHASFDGGSSMAIGGEVSYKWLFEGKWTVEPLVEIGLSLTDPEGFGTMSPFGLTVSIGYALD